MYRLTTQKRYYPCIIKLHTYYTEMFYALSSGCHVVSRILKSSDNIIIKKLELMCVCEGDSNKTANNSNDKDNLLPYEVEGF